MSDTTARIGVAAMWSVGARAGRFVLGLASSVIVVRSLGDYDYGVLSLIRTIMMFVVIVAAGGLGQALLKFLPTLRVQGSQRAARRLVTRVFVFHLVAWGALTIACYAFREDLRELFDYRSFDTLIAAAVALSVWELLFSLTAQLVNSNYDTRRLSIASLATHVVYIVMLGILLPMGSGVLGVLIAAACGNLAALAIVVGRVGPAVTFDGDEGGVGLTAGRLARYSIPFVAIGVLNLVVWRQSETLLLGYFRSAEEVGFFDLAYRLPQIILEFVPGTVWPLVMAGMSEAYARDPENLRRAVDRYYRMLFMLCAPIGITGMVLGGRVISVLYTPEMAPAALPAQLFFGIFTVSFLATPLSMALYVMEKTHVNLAVYGVLAAINIGLDVLLIPRYGVAGAIIPVALVIGLQPLLYRYALGRQLADVPIPFRFIGKCFLGASPVLLLVPLTRYVGSVPELVAAVVVAAVLVLLAFRWVRVLGVNEFRMLEAIPFPLAGRLLKFLGSPQP